MLKLPENRHAIAKRTGIIAALSSAVLLITPGAAMANGGNWAEQLGPAGQGGCYVYTNWTSDHVTGRIYQQGSDATCFVDISQWWRSTGDGTGGQAGNTSAQGQTLSVPDKGSYGYYYYGPSGNDYLCVSVAGQNNSTGQEAGVVYGTNC
jgi:hypothetical protein